MGERPLLSLCMIVRDEADVLARCLEIAAPVVDEMVIVDTGSTDDTAEIARRFGARVEYVAWQQDFARARNAGLELASGAWILQLDADEELRLSEDGADRVRRLLAVGEHPEAYTIQIVSPLDDGQQMRHEIVRLWRNRLDYRFEGPIHEQILPSILRANPAARVEPSGLEILHRGYARQVRNQEQKARRNLIILRNAAEDRPGDLFAHYNLGISQLQLGQFEEASAVLGDVHERMRGSEAWAPSLVRNYALALERRGDLDKAVEVLEHGLELWPDYTELLYLQGFIFLHRREYGRAMTAWKQCTLRGDPPSRYLSTEGVGSYLAHEQMGLLHMRLKAYPEAIAEFTAALRAKADFSRPLYHLAKALRELGHGPEQILQYLETHFHFATLPSRLLLADVLAGVGANEQALRQLDGLPPEAQAIGAVRQLRGRLLLALARFREALVELSAISPGSPEFPTSRRLVCLARWLDSPPALAYDALETLGQAGRAEEACFLAEVQRLMFGQGARTGAYDLLAPATRVTLGLDLIEQFLQLGAGRQADLASALIGGLAGEGASLRLGKLLFRLGHRERAAHWLLNALKEGLYDAESLKMLGEITIERDLFEEAEQMFAEALAMEPERLEHRLDLARIYLKQAKRCLERGLTFVPGAGLIKEELERVEECLRWL